MYKYRRGLKIYVINVMFFGVILFAIMLACAFSKNIPWAAAGGVMGGYILVFSLLVFSLPYAVISSEKITLRKRELLFDDIYAIKIKKSGVEDETKGVLNAAENVGSGVDDIEAVGFLLAFIAFISVFLGFYCLLSKIFSKSKLLTTYQVRIHHATFLANGKAVDCIKSIAEIRGIEFSLQQTKPKKKTAHQKSQSSL